jgi:hypothetical protein
MISFRVMRGCISCKEEGPALDRVIGRASAEIKISISGQLLWSIDQRFALGRECEVANLQEFNARAALCRRLAKLEPVSRHLWIAEAERWSRLARAKLQPQTVDDQDGLMGCANETAASAERDDLKV